MLRRWIRASPSRMSFSRLLRQTGAPVRRGGLGRLGCGGCAVWVSVHASGELGFHRDFATPHFGRVFWVASAARGPALRRRFETGIAALALHSRRGVIVRATDFHFYVRSARTTCFGRGGQQAARLRSGGPRPRSGREREEQLEASACSIDARRFGVLRRWRSCCRQGSGGSLDNLREAVLRHRITGLGGFGRGGTSSRRLWAARRAGFPGSGCWGPFRRGDASWLRSGRRTSSRSDERRFGDVNDCTVAARHARIGSGRGGQRLSDFPAGAESCPKRLLRRAWERGHGTGGNHRRATAAVMRYGC